MGTKGQMAMSRSPLKTEFDLARVLLDAGWQPAHINSVLQFPLTEADYKQLGTQSLFFLMSDPRLAQESRLKGKKAAAKILARQGWIEIEIDALLKPNRAFEPYYFSDFQNDFDRVEPATPKAQPKAKPPRSVTQKKSGTMRQYRQQMALNRLLGLLLVIIALLIFILVR
jgi:hypothetical protein